MRQLTLMIKVADVARADVLLTPERVYYRFATADNLEDGDLPGLKDRYLLMENRLTEALAMREGEQPDAEVKVDVFVDNVKHTAAISRQGIERAVAELTRIDDVFSFLRGFS